MHPTRTPATLPNSTGAATHNLFFLILCAQERAVRGTHLGLPCTQPTPLPVCTEATIPNCTGPHTYNLLFLILCAQERAVRGTHLGLSCTQPTPLPVCTEAMLPNCTGNCHPDEEPCRNIWRRGDGGTSTRLDGAHYQTVGDSTLKKAAKNKSKADPF